MICENNVWAANLGGKILSTVGSGLHVLLYNIVYLSITAKIFKNQLSPINEQFSDFTNAGSKIIIIFSIYTELTIL